MMFLPVQTYPSLQPVAKDVGISILDMIQDIQPWMVPDIVFNGYVPNAGIFIYGLMIRRKVGMILYMSKIYKPGIPIQMCLSPYPLRV